MTVATVSSRLLGLVLVLVATGAPVRAAPPAAAGAERQALVPVVTGNVDKAIMTGFEEFVATARQFYPDHKVRVGREVKEPLKKAVAKCGDDLVCVAKLGVREKLAEIIVMRVRPEGSGVAMAFIAVDVATAKAVRTVDALFTRADDVQPVVAAKFFAIVGITTPGQLSVPGAPAGGQVDGQAADLAAGNVELSPGVHVVKLNDHEVKTMILPGEIRSLKLEEFGIVPPPPPEKVAAASPTPTPTPALVLPAATSAEPVHTATAPATSGGGLPPKLLTYIGYGTAGLGVVLIGVGGYYGSQTEVKLSSTTSQAEAKRMNDDAKAAASRANTFMGVGGGLLVVGAALWAVDTYVLGASPAAGVTAAPAGGGATAGFWFRF